MTRSSRDAVAVSRIILHPVALAALALWIVNDHVLKDAMPGLLTGKLSDVASLIAFPLVPICALAAFRARRGLAAPSTAWVAGWIAATAAVMATINVFDWAATGYEYGLAVAQWPVRGLVALASGGALPGLAPVHLTMDPTDLWTLPFAVVPWLLVAQARTDVGQPTAGGAAVVTQSRDAAMAAERWQLA